MGNKPYIVLGFLEAKPGKEDELKEILRSLVKHTRNEPGCIKYELLQCQDEPSQFIFNEEWVDQSAFKNHTTMPYIQDWKHKKKDLLIAPNKIMTWEKIE